MRINIEADLRDVYRGLDAMESRAVRPAANAAINQALNFTQTRCVRYVRKRLREKYIRMKAKDIKRKGIVKKVKERRELSGAVYINQYRIKMTPQGGYNEGDVMGPLARTFNRNPVKGRPFVFTGKNSGKQMWGRRHPSNRLDNKWRSSQPINMYEVAAIQGSERAARVLQRLGNRYFYRRFNHELNRRLRRIRMQ